MRTGAGPVRHSAVQHRQARCGCNAVSLDYRPAQFRRRHAVPTRSTRPRHASVDVAGSGTVSALDTKMPELPSAKLAQNVTWPLSLKPLGRPSELPLPPRKLSPVTVRASPGASCRMSPLCTTSRRLPPRSVPQIPKLPSVNVERKASWPCRVQSHCRIVRGEIRRCATRMLRMLRRAAAPRR